MVSGLKIWFKIAGWLLVLMIMVGLMTIAAAGQGRWYPRFHRYAMTDLDSRTKVDMVKDMASGQCYAVYIVMAGGQPHTVTTLGVVPCDPIPVPPPVGTVPPASPIKDGAR